MYDVLSIQRENGHRTQILGKRTSPKKQKKEEKTKKGRRQLLRTCVWLSGRMHIEERRAIERRAAAPVKAKNENKTKRNKTNAAPEKDDMTSEKKTKKRPEYRSSLHLWLVNYGERFSTRPLALGFPLLGSSRHVRAYYCMP